MTLREHIERRQDNPNIAPLVERRQEPQRPTPAWIRRMQDGKLPAKELTGRAA